MAEPLPIDPQQSSIPSLPGVGKAGPPAKRDEAQPTGVEFRALLERLQARAHDLADESSRVQSPDELGRAVDTARASLKEALSLKDRLLEAYRQNQTQSDAQPGKGAQ